MDATMIVDVSSGVVRVDLLREAVLRFGGDERVTPFVEAPGALAFVVVEDAGDVIGWCRGYLLVRPDAPRCCTSTSSRSPKRIAGTVTVAPCSILHGRRQGAGATKMFLSAARVNEPARRLYEFGRRRSRRTRADAQLLVCASRGQISPASTCAPARRPCGSGCSPCLDAHVPAASVAATTRLRSSPAGESSLSPRRRRGGRRVVAGERALAFRAGTERG